ncbi:MAG: ABC transporter permease, partial [Gemmatimonadota bacterium]
MKWTHGMWARLRLLQRREAEERMDEEIRFHLDMETEKNLRGGMTPGEARRQAVLAFGGVEAQKEAVREGRSLAWLDGMSLDVKLAWRRLVKQPGLVLVGGLGIALAVAISTVFFSLTDAVLHSTLPFEEGERVVAIEIRDTGSNDPERQILHDLAVWGEELEYVEDVGAWSSVVRNLIVAGGAANPVTVAEISASGFRLARVPPLLGRPLVGEDERAGAPPVAVIGHDVWQARFGGDPDVVGREIRLGGTVRTVVGVMPEGFGFPVNHSLWIPLRLDPTAHDRREGPEIFIFGRLAPGATLEAAQAELTTVGLQMAAAFPETDARLRPRVVPYTLQYVPDTIGFEFALIQLLIVLLLVVICVNVAVLAYARTVTRAGEVAVRSALGARRRRIVAQLSAEALVLSLGAATVGVTLARLLLGWFESFEKQGGDLSFWVDYGLSPGVVIHAVGLALLGALIVGVGPALKATGRQLRTGLSGLGGATGMRLGRTWTALIVAQVAIAATVLPAATYGTWNYFRYGFAQPGFAADEFLTARLEMDVDAAPSAEAEDAERTRAGRYGDRLGELVARLEAEPGVADITFATLDVAGTLPASIEVEDVPAPEESPTGHSIRTNYVDVDYFDAFGIPVLAGRGFRSGDVGAAATAIIVNNAFVEQV